MSAARSPNFTSDSEIGWPHTMLASISLCCCKSRTCSKPTLQAVLRRYDSLSIARGSSRCAKQPHEFLGLDSRKNAKLSDHPRETQMRPLLSDLQQGIQTCLNSHPTQESHLIPSQTARLSPYFICLPAWPLVGPRLKPMVFSEGTGSRVIVVVEPVGQPPWLAPGLFQSFWT